MVSGCTVQVFYCFTVVVLLTVVLYMSVVHPILVSYKYWKLWFSTIVVLFWLYRTSFPSFTFLHLYKVGDQVILSLF